ncbi:MAG TPA: helix-turn-helix domain-containing protein [Solirubrobacterales bacterium]
MSPSRPRLPRDFVLRHKRRRILAAVAEVSAERGYGAMKVSDIVKRAGVARKTLYELYEGKEEVFLAAVDAAFAALLERTEEACAAGGEWDERVRAGLAALLGRLAEHPAEAHLLIVEAPAATTASAARYEVARARFVTLLSEAVPAGQRRPDVLEGMIVSGVAWILNGRIRAGEAKRVNDLIDDLCDFALAHWERPVR